MRRTLTNYLARLRQKKSRHWYPLLAAFLVLACVVLSGCSLFDDIVGVDEIDPHELHQMLRSTDPPQLLDVSHRDEYTRAHLPGARWLDPKEVESLFASMGFDPSRPLVAICAHGNASVMAAAVAQARGVKEVRSLRGGMHAWQRHAGYPTLQGEPRAHNLQPVFYPVTWTEQAAVVASGLVIKPIYMVLNLLIVFFLRRQRARDLALIRWGMASFFLGEAFCALNYACGDGTNYVLDMLHGLGMVGMGFLLPWGLFLLLDCRALVVTNPDGGCALRRLCGRCWKQDQGTCLIKRVLFFMALALAAMCVMPFHLTLHPLHRVSEVFDTPVVFDYPLDLQLAELRAYPAIGLLCLMVSALLLLGKARDMKRAQLPFFLGFGFMSYSLFRFILYRTYRLNPAWSDFWEEATEFMMIAGIGLLLYLYRQRLSLPLRLFGRVPEDS